MESALRQRGHAMTISVRRLGPDDLDALREIRLEALRLHPDCFAADLETEEAMAPQEWSSRLASAATFGGFADGALSGIAVFARPRFKKTMHTGELGAMYVRAMARGKGLADAILNAVIDQASGEVEQIKLTVNAENSRAIKFYERHGFRMVGKYPNSLRVGGRTYEELIMVRPVSASD